MIVDGETSPLILYRIMCESYGREISTSEWWRDSDGIDWPAPKQAVFERAVGAVLAIGTRWRKVERGIENLRKLGLLEPAKLIEAEPSSLVEAIRPVGRTRRKVRSLLGLARLMRNLRPEDHPTETLRSMLLDVSGVRRETADVILLFAFERPVIPVTPATVRILRDFCGMTHEGYEEIQSWLEEKLPMDVDLYRTFVALAVEVGLNFYSMR